MTRTLGIDLETFSSVDLRESGVYAYAESPDFEILLFAYAWDDEPVQCVDLVNLEELPPDVLAALTDPAVTKTAYNAAFERTCISRHFGLKMDPAQWRCTSVLALSLGLPNYLDGVAKALGLDVQKDAAGKNLIRYFSIPCKPTAANGGRTRNFPGHAPEKWEQYKSYCITDVEVEREIKRRLDQYALMDDEQRLWVLDQQINDRGIRIHPVLVANAVDCDAQYKARLTEEAATLSGLDNPNSVAQLKEWLREAGELEVDTLRKDDIPILLQAAGDDTVKRMLRIRQEMSKSSVKKYIAMQRARCLDDRIRGLLQFLGASRTGRWAGRLVQVQNLTKNKAPDIGLARELLISGDYELLEMMFGSLAGILSQMIRTAFIPSEGKRFGVADFSAIEARVIAWLAGEAWRLEVFATHGKIYEASAAQMFKVPIESIGKGSDLRQRGKVAELALGYQGGPNALVNMGALDMGIPEDDLQPLVDAWREANPNIVNLWYTVGNAAIKALQSRQPVPLMFGAEFIPTEEFLFFKLPSGRRLAYYKPQLKNNRFGKPALSYMGSESGKWVRMESYGGKLVENLVQAVARDCLAVNLLRVDAEGYPIVMHVHDELVAEVPGESADADLKHICDVMGRPIEWAPGLALRADGYLCDYYMKD